MSIEKSHTYFSETKTDAGALSEFTFAKRRVITGSLNHSRFRQCLDDSNKQQDVDEKKSQSKKDREYKNVSSTVKDHALSLHSAAIKNAPLLMPPAGQAACLMQAASLIVPMPVKLAKSFSGSSRAEKFRKHLYTLVCYAIQNCDRSDVQNQSVIVFKSSDGAQDKYIMKFNKTGYCLSIHTQAEQFANDLRRDARAFESEFFSRTSHKLEITISVTKSE